MAVGLLGIAGYAFFPKSPVPDDFPQQKPPSKWIYTKKVLKVRNIEFREGLETSFIFNFDPQDSVKIRCVSCLQAVTEGKLQVTFQGNEGQAIGITRTKFDGWLPIYSVTGKFGVIFYGKKNVMINDLEIIRKSDSSKVRPGPDLVPLDVKGLFIDGIADDPAAKKTEFYFDLARRDLITILAKTVGGDMNNLNCDWYKEGETFNTDIAPFNSPFNIPPDAAFFGNYIFEFGVKEKSKDNIFNIRLERVPAKIEKPVEITADGDTISAENALLMELIKALTPVATPEFDVVGIATQSYNVVPSRLNFATGNSNRQCFELALSEESADPTGKCPDCSFWVYWIGVGQEAVNQYKFRDSTRKMLTQKGVIEAYANSVKFMKVSGVGIFPVISEGEDVFFAIVNEANKEKFFEAKRLPPAAGESLGFSALAAGLQRTGYQILPYSPGEKTFLCLCNNNELSPVPVLFNYQQFLSLADTAKASGK